LKWDFAGKLTDPVLRGRSNPMVVTIGLEALRGVMQELQTALDAGAGEKTVMLDCSGIDGAGVGIARVLYCAEDSGNSGFSARGHLQEIYTSFAVHLFKRRWAMLQPSCLIVGLPGTIDEARIRATATFMGAGQIDLGDDLATLPDERWRILTATLPPNDQPADIVDLWDSVHVGPIPCVDGTWETMFSSKEPPAQSGANVWRLPVATSWDSWSAVALFNWGRTSADAVNLPVRVRVELTQLGFKTGDALWGYEFWSDQFLGVIPRGRSAPETYWHRGDLQRLLLDSDPGWLDVVFFGPAVKLLIIRPARKHPWPVATSFHQSGGRELSEVSWDGRKRMLSGNLLRPTGESGFLVIADPTDSPLSVKRVPILASADVTPWSVQF
jgi:hypothetical protein